MKYDKIFWMEDMADWLGYTIKDCAHHGVDKDSLFSRITFACDYEQGAEIVNREDFDLYIIDGDFPNSTTIGEKEQFANDLASVNAETELNDLSGEIARNSLSCNFVKFYRKFLTEKSGDAIIYSGNLIAPQLAFHLDLPFYSKWADEKVTEWAIRKDGYGEHLMWLLPKGVEMRPPHLLNNWEHGSREDLIKRYLVR